MSQTQISYTSLLPQVTDSRLVTPQSYHMSQTQISYSSLLSHVTDSRLVTPHSCHRSQTQISYSPLLSQVTDSHELPPLSSMAGVTSCSFPFCSDVTQTQDVQRTKLCRLQRCVVYITQCIISLTRISQRQTLGPY